MTTEIETLAREIWEELHPLLVQLDSTLDESFCFLRIRGVNPECVNSPSEEDGLSVWINPKTSRMSVEEAMERSRLVIGDYMSSMEEIWAKALSVVGPTLDHIALGSPSRSRFVGFEQGAKGDPIGFSL